MDFHLISILALAVFSFLLGAIPFGMLAAYLNHIDLRAVGSGNIGATNVYRALGIKWALLVFFCDMVKAAIPVLLAVHYFANPWVHVLSGAAAILGHSFSPFAGFKGGKGVASGLGFLCVLNPIVFVSVACMAGLTFLIFRTISVVSLLGCVLTPILFLWLSAPLPYTITVSMICLLIVARHTSNIKRLLSGQEKKII